ncbi:hypothetical protein R52603_03452 [Paraburkholderia saeva]|nr:hypothetical protein R52603_03452 [Paraburkholderia saeva]
MLRAAAIPLLIAGLVVAVFFVWEGRVGLSLADEGYLWYGAQRTLLGEVPIRDFMAYDPGRYYWCAAFLSVLGNSGIMAVRISVAVFAGLGVACGLGVLRGGARQVGLLQSGVAAVVLVIWMFPRHKLFDITISLALVGALYLLLSRTSRVRYLLLGIAAGLAAVLGRNHGVYGVAGSALGFGYLLLAREDRHTLLSGFPLWVLGVLIGYLPVLAMLIAVPGFSSAFWQDVLFLFHIKTTNLTLPVPWPWNISLSGVGLIWTLRDILVGCAFLALLVLGCLALLYLAYGRARRQAFPPGLVASACFILPYAHYAFSRADVGHLALGIYPLLLFLLICIARLRPVWNRIALTAMLGVSALIMLPVHPGWQCRSATCPEVSVGGDKLIVDQGIASDLALLQKLVHDFAPHGESFVATPFWPAAYAIVGRASPVWEIYALSPYRSPEFERSEIERIRAASPDFVIVVDTPLDGRDDLRFHNTHPLMARYFSEHFARVSGYTNNPDYWIYKKSAIN